MALVVYQLFINTARFLVSKDFRDTLGRLVGKIRSTSEWNHNFIRMKARIKRLDRELALAFCEAACVKLKEQHFSPTTINNFKTVFGELVDNGFTHGCKTDLDSLTIRALLFDTGIALEVINANKSNRLPANVGQIRNRIDVKVHDRGHGLPLVFSIADQFEILKNGSGVKAVLYNHDVAYHCIADDGITFITLGAFMTDYRQKIDACLKQHKTENVILICGDLSYPLSIFLDALRVANESDDVIKIAAVVSEARRKQLDDLGIYYPSKFIGLHSSPENAMAAVKFRASDKIRSSNKRKQSKKMRR